MIISRLLLISLMITALVACQTPPDPKTELDGPIVTKTGKEFCQSAREYVTTLEYLRKNDDRFALNETQRREVANRVSLGCTGAAERFSETVELMMKLEIGSMNALYLGQKLAFKERMFTEAFLKVFKKAYLAEYLDLDIKRSVRLAEVFALEFEGDLALALEDFEELVLLCIRGRDFGLSHVHCADVAGQVAIASGKSGISLRDDFIKAYEFLQAQDGVRAPLGLALKVAKRIVVQGPGAVDNFITAYKYSVKEQGLGMDARRSIRFALEMAHRTSAKESLSQRESSERLPASRPIKKTIEVEIPASTPVAPPE